MCQYSVTRRDGVPVDWHLVNLGKHATGGFGLVMTEATAVLPEGRISPLDTGIWSDDHIEPWRRITSFVGAQGAVPAIQLGHAGRRASTYAPFAVESGSVPAGAGGWATFSSTARALDGFAAPQALTAAGIAQVVGAFAAAARRADAAGFGVVEVHAAHGYLIHQFLSPLINDRTDEYGGSFQNRCRLAVQVAEAIRAAWPDDKPVFFRISGTDWATGGWDAEQAGQLALLLKQAGVDLIDVSSGGSIPGQQIPVGPGYQVPLAQRVKQISDMHVSTVGLITEPAQAEQILVTRQADAVMLARAAIREPAWALRAAHELGVPSSEIAYPPAHTRGAWR